jgi:hypothetical protein
MNAQWGCHVYMFHLPNQLTCQMMVSSCVFTPCSCWLFQSFRGMYCFYLQVKWVGSSWCWSIWRKEMFWLRSMVWGSLVITATEGKGSSKLMRVDISKHHPVLSGLHQWGTKIILYCLSSVVKLNWVWSVLGMGDHWHCAVGIGIEAFNKEHW